MARTLEDMKSWGVIAEKQAWFPKGRNIDGAPYSVARITNLADDQKDFYVQADRHFGFETLEKKVEEMHGDLLCANWALWASFILLGVARVTEKSVDTYFKYLHKNKFSSYKEKPSIL